MRAIAPDFEAIVKRRSSVEGMFRYIQQRLRVHGESVAFFGGNKREVRPGVTMFPARPSRAAWKRATSACPYFP